MRSEVTGGYAVLWEFAVRPGAEEAFCSAYAPGGAWSALFERSAGYLGTILLRDRSRPSIFVTLDRWRSREALEAFRREFRGPYEALDARCAPLCESERLLGEFLETVRARDPRARESGAADG